MNMNNEISRPTMDLRWKEYRETITGPIGTGTGTLSYRVLQQRWIIETGDQIRHEWREIEVVR